MIVYVTEQSDCRLEDPHNFKQFKVQLAAPIEQFDRLRKALAALVDFEDNATAWVSVNQILALSPAGEEAAWQAEFKRMIEKARPHGWIRDEPNLAIKAHVVWPGSRSP